MRETYLRRSARQHLPPEWAQREILLDGEFFPLRPCPFPQTEYALPDHAVERLWHTQWLDTYVPRFHPRQSPLAFRSPA